MHSTGLHLSSPDAPMLYASVVQRLLYGKYDREFRRDQSSVHCCTYCTQLTSQHLWNPWVSKCTSTSTTPNFTIPVLHRTLAFRVNTAIEAVSSWMSSNRLCLNLDKTKYLWFGTRQKLGQRDTVALSTISAALVSNMVVRNLGLLLDQELSMVDRITKLSQVLIFQPSSYSRHASFVDP